MYGPHTVNGYILIFQKKLNDNSYNPSKRMFFDILLGKTLGNLGYYESTIGNNHIALEYYTKALPISYKYDIKPFQGDLLNNMGYMHLNNGSIKKALDYFYKGLKVYEQINLKEGIATSLNNIGHIYKKQGNSEKALLYYKKSLKLEKELNNEIGMATSLNNIGYIYNVSKKYDSAIKYYQKSLAIRKKIGDFKGIANTFNNIAFIYKNKQNYEKAFDYFHQSLENSISISDKKAMANTYHNIGELYLTLNQLNKAKENLTQSYTIAKKIKSPEQIKVATITLSQLYEKENEWAKALEMYKLHVQMKDSLKNLSIQQETYKQQAQYEYEKQKAIDDAVHESKMKIITEKQSKQQVIIYAILITSSLLIIFLIIITNRWRVTRNQKKVIQEKNSQLSIKNTQILDSINYAKRLQIAILSKEDELKDHFKHAFVYYQPKDQVSGDFYWVKEKEGILYFAVADCTGHGVPGALLSIVCSKVLDDIIKDYSINDPSEILNCAHEEIVNILNQEYEQTIIGDGMDISLCMYDQKLQKLKFSAAKNQGLLFSDKELITLEANKFSIGFIFRKKIDRRYTSSEVTIKKGDQLYLFSDGYMDQFGGNENNKLNYYNFIEYLAENRELSPLNRKSHLENKFNTWKGDRPQMDDVTVMGIEF